MKLYKIFCYGTLKRGGHFHKQHLSGSTFLGECETSDNYSLYIGRWPFLIEEKSDKPVKGELYEVTDAILTALDYLEGSPDFYKRKKIEISGEQDVWGYIFPKDGLDLGKLRKEYNYDLCV